jgi:hypothetical protein
MPLDSQGKILYKTSHSGEPQYQANPPVCNRCKKRITPQNFGWAYLVDDEGNTEEVEFIECTSCTPVRECGEALQVFLQRHNLHKTTPEDLSNYARLPTKIF